MTALFAIARLQLRLLRRDPWFVVIMFVMPLLVMPLFKETLGLSLEASGFTSASGAEQVVPGQVVLFSFFVGGAVGFSLFRFHAWNTWDRLRASAAPPWALLGGIALPWILIHATYQVVLLTSGGLALGLRFHGGSPLAELLVVLAYTLCLVTLMLAAAATVRTVNQMAAVQNVGAMLLGGLGGAIVPFERLPGWAQTISRATPTYWAMRGHRSVFLERGGLGDVILPVAVLLGFAALFTLYGLRRFRVDETKDVLG